MKISFTFDLGEGFPAENPYQDVPGGVFKLIPSIPVPESSGKVVSFKMGENNMDASLVPTNDLLGVSGAEKLKYYSELILGNFTEGCSLLSIRNKYFVRVDAFCLSDSPRQF